MRSFIFTQCRDFRINSSTENFSLHIIKTASQLSIYSSSLLLLVYTQSHSVDRNKTYKNLNHLDGSLDNVSHINNNNTYDDFITVLILG